MIKNKLIFLSDIHIGSNEPTNWYQASIHEPFLNAALQYVINNKHSIQELIIVGDLIDFWTYLPNIEPPPLYSPIKEVASIMGNNKGIFGDADNDTPGQLGKAVIALDGKVSFVHGNHDMSMTQAMLDKIPTGNVSSIKLQDEIYFPLSGNKDIVCAHGHQFSMLCAPDHEHKNRIKPLPLGYYVTRAGAYYAQKSLNKNQPNVAYLPNTGEPVGINFGVKGWAAILGDIILERSVGATITAAIHAETNLKWDADILLPGGESTTLNNAYKDFANLFTTLRHSTGIDGKPLGYEGAVDALRYPDIDNDLQPYAEQVASHFGSKVVIFGHTHVPKDNAFNNGRKYIYANSGFNCPSIPDMDKPDLKHPTFIELEITVSEYIVRAMEVVKKDAGYTAQQDPNIPALRINRL